MGTPFLSELRLFTCNYAPQGWTMCNGQPLPINQNQALFALLGTTYGGNGQTHFNLPDLRGRAPIHEGAGRTLGEKAGTEAHTVTLAEMPTHLHGLQGRSDAATTASPSGALLARAAGNPYAPQGGAQRALRAGSVIPVCGNQPHLNMQPFLTLTWCIALIGAFPSQN